MKNVFGQLLFLSAVAALGWNIASPKAVTYTSVKKTPLARQSRAPASIESPVLMASAPVKELSALKDIESEIKKLPLKTQEARLLSSPDINKWERKLKLALVARYHSNKINGAEDIGGVYVDQMKHDPAAAMAAIKSLISKVSAKDFAVDRASLIDVAGDIKGYEREAQALAKAEINTSIVPARVAPGPQASEAEIDRYLSGDDFELLPMVSHSVLMRTSKNKSEALQMTISAMKVQKDPGVRDTMRTQFAQQYPAGLSELDNAMQAEL